MYKVFIIFRKKHYLLDPESEPTVSEGEIFQKLKRIFHQEEEIQIAAA